MIFCGSVYPIIFGASFFYIAIIILSLTSIAIQKNIKTSNLKSFKKATSVLILFLTINWIFTEFNLEYTEYLTHYFFIIIYNLSFLALANKGNLSLKTFDFIFKILLIHALLNFIICSSLKEIFTDISSNNYRSKHLYYVFFYLAEESILNINIIRNQGIFWEPGVLSVVFNIYLFRCLFGDKIKNRKTTIFLISFVIITTVSTTGLFLLFLQIVFYLFKQKLSKIIKIIYSITIILISLPILYSNINEKISGKNEMSYNLRNYDMLLAVDIIKNNYLTGIGFSKTRNIDFQKNSETFVNSNFLETRANTNSVLSVFVFLGIPIGIALFYIFYNQKIVNYNKKFFFFIIIICLSSEPLIFNGFFIFFISSYFYKIEN